MMQQDGMFSLQGSRHYYHHSRVSRTILGGAVLKNSVNTLEVHLFFKRGIDPDFQDTYTSVSLLTHGQFSSHPSVNP